MSNAMSLKARIRNIARQKNIPAQVVLQNYMFERLLVRLSASPYKDKFVLKGGMLVTNPIPEEYSMDHEVINRAIDEAIEAANAQGIHGKATTPFLLAKVKELTGGDSLDSNIQLVFNNARLAAQTACELSKL